MGDVFFRLVVLTRFIRAWSRTGHPEPTPVAFQKREGFTGNKKIGTKEFLPEIRVMANQAGKTAGRFFAQGKVR